MELIVEKPDLSVQKVIDKTAKNLETKYSKTRKINEFILEFNRTGWKKVISFLLSIILVILSSLCIVLGFSTAINKINKTLPNFAGYSVMQVSSGSMIASGFNIGDKIIIKDVDEKTLKVGDKIAFYVDQRDYMKYYSHDVEELYEFNEPHRSNISFTEFLGIQSSELQEAGKSGCTIVFHEIIRVFEDENGARWFKTKGSSNASADVWFISENMVIGIYDDSGFAHFMGGILTFLLTKTGLVSAIIIPMSAIMIMLVYQFLKEFEYAKLEFDVVEEKRKITDPICVKNDIGFRMDNKTKYKVLAQAEGEEKFEYLPLLWENGNAPKNVKKYVYRKTILQHLNKKLLELNRKCQEDYKKGVKTQTIAKYYLAEKEKIDKEYNKKLSRFNRIHNSYKKKTNKINDAI